MKYAWIEDHRDICATTMVCELLSVSRSGLDAARAREPSPGARAEKRSWSSRFEPVSASIEAGTAEGA